MVKIATIVFCLISTTMACSQMQKFGPGYQFSLFKNTPVVELAKAVNDEDTIAIKKLARKKDLNINFKEPQFGRTLLLLAIGNDKLNSTKALLESGSDINIADLQNTKPIHEASQFIPLKKHTLAMLSMLISYGANVNDTLLQKSSNGDTSKFYVPLMGACQNLECAKLLLEHGANPYIELRSSVFGNTYLIWSEALNGDNLNDNIFFAKYMIIDKKLPIPEYIVYNIPDKHPADIYYYLNFDTFNGNVEKEKARTQLLNYLKQINFPQKDIYKSKF